MLTATREKHINFVFIFFDRHRLLTVKTWTRIECKFEDVPFQDKIFHGPRKSNYILFDHLCVKI